MVHTLEIENAIFHTILTSLWLDLSGKYFDFIHGALLFAHAQCPLEYIFLCIGDLKMLPSLGMHHIYGTI